MWSLQEKPLRKPAWFWSKISLSSRYLTEMDCSVDNGFISVQMSNYGCLNGCEYTCYPGYKNTGSDSVLVYCDIDSSEWYIPGTASPPCTKDIQDGLSSEAKAGNIAIQDDLSSGTIAGIIAGSIIAFVILVGTIRICVSTALRRRRERRLREAAISIVADAACRAFMNQVEQARMERERERIRMEQEEYTRRMNAAVSRGNSGTNTDRENDNQGYIIFRIRRFFTFTPNPYGALRNPPEPPPYDAESVAPPAYEESEGAHRVTSGSRSGNYQPFREARAGQRQESPPPYPENFI